MSNLNPPAGYKPANLSYYSVYSLVLNPKTGKWVPMNRVACNNDAFTWPHAKSEGKPNKRPKSYRIIEVYDTDALIRRGDLVTFNGVEWFYANKTVGMSIKSFCNYGSNFKVARRPRQDTSITVMTPVHVKLEVTPEVTPEAASEVKPSLTMPDYHYIVTSGDVEKGDYVLNPRLGWEYADAMIGCEVENCSWKVCRSFMKTVKPEVKSKVVPSDVTNKELMDYMTLLMEQIKRIQNKLGC